MFKLAVSQYKTDNLTTWEEYTAKIKALVLQAQQENAQLLLLPEYAGTEIVCGYQASEEKLFNTLQPLIPRYLSFYQQLAQQHQLYIAAGTIIEQITPQQFVNRAYFFAPSGAYSYQDKLQLTEFEKSLQLLQPGTEQRVYQTSLGNIGIAICYDSEFPEIVHRLVKLGAELILVPSYTSTLAGFYRVFLSSRARAIENQCYVATSCMVKNVELSGDSEDTFGYAAILGPADNGFPDDGILAQGEMNNIMLVTADISIKKIHLVRKRGQVHNFTDTQRCESLSERSIALYPFK